MLVLKADDDHVSLRSMEGQKVRGRINCTSTGSPSTTMDCFFLKKDLMVFFRRRLIFLAQSMGVRAKHIVKFWGAVGFEW